MDVRPDDEWLLICCCEHEGRDITEIAFEESLWATTKDNTTKLASLYTDKKRVMLVFTIYQKAPHPRYIYGVARMTSLPSLSIPKPQWCRGNRAWGSPFTIAWYYTFAMKPPELVQELMKARDCDRIPTNVIRKCCKKVDTIMVEEDD